MQSKKDRFEKTVIKVIGIWIERINNRKGVKEEGGGQTRSRTRFNRNNGAVYIVDHHQGGWSRLRHRLIALGLDSSVAEIWSDLRKVCGWWLVFQREMWERFCQKISQNVVIGFFFLLSWDVGSLLSPKIFKYGARSAFQYFEVPAI